MVTVIGYFFKDFCCSLKFENLTLLPMGGGDFYEPENNGKII